MAMTGATTSATCRWGAEMNIKVSEALLQLLWSQITDHCAYAEQGEDHSTLFTKLDKAKPGEVITLTAVERKDLWNVCDYIEECWDDDPQSRRLARRWRDRVACECDVRS